MTRRKRLKWTSQDRLEFACSGAALPLIDFSILETELRVGKRFTVISNAFVYFFSAQESPGEQHRTLERSTAVVARAHRMGDKERHGAYRLGTRLRRRGCSTKTTGKPIVPGLDISRID